LPKMNKQIIIVLLCCQIFFFSCTNTPWHKEQAEVFLNKGISLIEAGQFNNALKELLEAEKYSSGDAKIHYYMGMAYHGKGLRDKAMDEFKVAISSKENYSEAHNYLGTLYMDMELWDKALEEFDKALANDMYDTPSFALYNSGWAYYNKKDYQQALSKYQQALQRDPKTILRPQIEKNIGLIYLDQSNLSEAIRHFNIAVELSPFLYDAQLFLGESYLKIKDKTRAKKAFQAVIKYSPDSTFGKKAKEHLQSIK
jgi:type IV pilus assembly protein PilF